MFHKTSASCPKHISRSINEVVGNSTKAQVEVENVSGEPYVCYCGKPAKFHFKRIDDAKAETKKTVQNRPVPAGRNPR